VIANLEKGGAQRVMLNLCHSLKNKHTIEIIALRESEIGYPIDNIFVRVLKKNQMSNRFLRFFNLRSQLKEILMNENYDGVISFLPEANFMICSIKDHSFKIINVRNDPTIEYKGIYYPLMRYFYPKTNHCVVQTEKIKQYFESFISKISVIPNPVSEIPNFACQRKPIILSAGRLVPQKNHELLIRAFKSFSEDYAEYECHIYGEGRLKNDLNQLINQLNLFDKVKIFDPTNQLFERMQEAQIFVLSSNYEGYPNVLLEAMVCGCAVISTDYDSKASASIIQNDVNGYLIPVKDKEALVKSMIRCVDPETQKRLSENAKRIKFTHSTEQFTQTYSTILESYEKSNVKS
jgi:glycosyltransferase involved in cell wall biosynthesis